MQSHNCLHHNFPLPSMLSRTSQCMVSTMLKPLWNPNNHRRDRGDRDIKMMSLWGAKPSFRRALQPCPLVLLRETFNVVTDHTHTNQMQHQGPTTLNLGQRGMLMTRSSQPGGPPTGTWKAGGLQEELLQMGRKCPNRPNSHRDMEEININYIIYTQEAMCNHKVRAQP